MDTLDGWKIEERIGAGGLADVYRAVPEHGEGRHVALKVLREADRSVAHRKRFLREGRLLARMSHPGLPRCSEAVDGPQPYLVLELLRGRTLSECVKSGGPLDPQQASIVATSILRVLGYLHERGIVHRDVKSSNIYLADDRRVLLLDLGLAADPADPLTTTLGDVMGTYAYMAPEQLSGAEVDHRCDLYSLGVTLYEALAGVRPYQARGAAGYLQATRDTDPLALSEICLDAPARLLDTVSRLMARDPTARPSSAGIALAMLTGSGGVHRTLERPPMVGRAAAIGAIQAAFDVGGVVVITGEIGSGTSRMASWALSAARDLGFETIALRCSDRGPPNDVIDQLARDLARLAGPVRTDARSLGKALADQAAEGPVLVVLEGAEQCAPEAGRVLAEVLRAAPNAACVVTGVRPAPYVTGHEVGLRVLTVGEVGQVLRGMLGTRSPPAGLAARLHRMSGGLPAIVVLAVNELVTRQALWFEGIGDDGASIWRLDRSVTLTPTTGMVRLFGDVLAGLGAPARRLLDLMAVAGAALPLDVALEVAELDPLDGAHGPLIRTGLAQMERRESGDWLRLRRPAVGTLVVRQVPAERRIVLHRGLATALARLDSTAWRDQRVAWHGAHAIEGRGAPEALLSLAEQLHTHGQDADALGVLHRAVSHPRISPAVAAQLAVVRGEVLESLGRREEAAEALHAARRLAEDVADDSLLARALVDLATVYQAVGDERRAGSMADEALDILDQRPQDPSLPRALLLVARNLYAAAHPDQAADLCHRCIDTALEQDRPLCAALAHGWLGVMMAEEGQLDDGVRHLEQESAFLRVHGLHKDLVEALYWLSVCRRRLGRVEGALAALDEALHVSASGDLHYERALVRVGRAQVLNSVGDVDGCSQELVEARHALDRDARAGVRLAYREAQLEARLGVADHQAALATCKAAEVDAGRSGYVAVGAYFVGIMGVLTADAEALTESMDILSCGGDRREWARLLLLGASVGGDAEVLSSAEEEARACGDRFLLLARLGQRRAPPRGARCRGRHRSPPSRRAGGALRTGARGAVVPGGSPRLIAPPDRPRTTGVRYAAASRRLPHLSVPQERLEPREV
ncbi:MAG: protein kinase [Oligoflexia bacterium]|nr:protein kinase [Oligoflexia bacterium]